MITVTGTGNQRHLNKRVVRQPQAISACIAVAVELAIDFANENALLAKSDCPEFSGGI
jgi:hypothetical protein